ncbi:fluoride efflux transporter FluC [Nakamurella aerolata]|uniref:Fluoride-specific ion channel FluC n=1 Tax=Nakamurella aerolata TaxID=1656892 RepID=A0A849AFV9_9ACTN|nr:CrcB family protein [Nakamurella aerolata]NNG35712.1 chromosome condensation protein CrcB [Nakamurella aerolata]
MNQPWALLAAALAGGAGAALRFAVDSALNTLRRTDFPIATSLVNLTGSLLLGLLTGVALGHGNSPAWLTIAGGGLLGGYTTFSAAAVESVRLLEQRRYRAGALTSLGMLIAGVLAAGAGLLVGYWLRAA